MVEAAKEAAKFLKSTLRLPSSKFPPRPSPADLAKYLPRCTDNLYEWQRKARPTQKSFVLHDGPPYANGDLHIGHALNKIVKDIICRTKLAEGYRVSYVPGWDCHGLPIELKALEKHGWKRGHGVDAVAIRKAARKFAYDAVKKQMKSFRSWGVMADWDKHWKTMDKDFELRQLSVFKAMAEKGLIYRKYKPVYWSPSTRTALAEAEMEYQDDFESTAALIKFPLHGPLESHHAHVAIWTTTPWTIPANQAIAINESIKYNLVQSKQHGKIVVASSRIPYMEEQLQETLEVIDEIAVKDLLECTYSGLSEFGPDARDRPILHADFVKDDSGTGLVHCAPGHGKDDYEALQPLINSGQVQVKAPVDDLGQYTDAASPSNPGLLSGLYVYKEGNQKILELLEQNGSLLSSYAFKHKYTIDWRTREPVMTRATAQWFADVSVIKKATLKSLKEVTFKPDTGVSRLRSFIENRSEWCISRQRAWGVPIPALYHKETGEAVLTPESIDHIISTIQLRGIDAWWSDSPNESAWMPAGLSCTDYIRGSDTMDVWFDSGTSWSLMSNESGTKAIADVYLEGSDQHRGWFQSSLLTSIAYQTSVSPDQPAHAPFRTLITHGFTLDANERKMSKSVGNVIAPDEIIAGLAPPKTSKKYKQLHAHGPDVLRLWAASSDWTKDVVISEKVVSTVHTTLDKYRVTIKLLLGMLQDFDADRLVVYEDMAQVDQIALLQLYQVSNSVRTSLSGYEFQKAVSTINKWVATDLSGFYFEAIKDVIYCDSPSNVRRRSAQTALYHIFNQFQNILGPLTPLLVEETYEYSPEDLRNMTDHPLRRTWDTLPALWNNTTLLSQIPLLMSINTSVKAAQEKARSEKLMGQSLASEVLVWLKPDCGASQELSETTYKEVLVVSGFTFLQQHPSNLDFHQFPQDEEARVETRRAYASLYKTTDVDSWVSFQEVEGAHGNVVGFVVVRSPSAEKCARCWRYEVSEKARRVEDSEQLLCQRCEDVVEGCRPK